MRLCYENCNSILFEPSRKHKKTGGRHCRAGGGYFDAIRKITKAKKCRELGAYQCLGYDTFGPFKLVGGISKGHPTEDEIAGAVKFYRAIECNYGG